MWQRTATTTLVCVAMCVYDREEGREGERREGEGEKEKKRERESTGMVHVCTCTYNCIIGNVILCK